MYYEVTSTTNHKANITGPALMPLKKNYAFTFDRVTTLTVSTCFCPLRSLQKQCAGRMSQITGDQTNIMWKYKGWLIYGCHGNRRGGL